MNTGPRNPGNPSRYSRDDRPEMDGDRPLPPEVYRRRRITAIIVLVVVIGLIWWLISSIGGTDEDTSNQAAQTSATSTSPDMTSKAEPPNSKTAEPTDAKDSDSDKDDAKKDKEEKSTAAEAKKSTCELGDLRVTAVPGADTFEPGASLNFYATIHNPTKADCDIDVDDNPLKFEVFALDDYHRIWGDLDCNDPSINGSITIEAGKSKNYEMGSWSRTTSAPDQCDDRKPVDAGAYMLYSHLGDNVSEPATFNLQ